MFYPIKKNFRDLKIWSSGKIFETHSRSYLKGVHHDLHFTFFASYFIQYITRNCMKIHLNFSGVWVMARPSKFLSVILADQLNFLQRKSGKYSSSQKKLYTQKKAKPKNDAFWDFHLKNNGFLYWKKWSFWNFAKILCKKS